MRNAKSTRSHSLQLIPIIQDDPFLTRAISGGPLGINTIYKGITAYDLIEAFVVQATIISKIRFSDLDQPQRIRDW